MKLSRTVLVLGLSLTVALSACGRPYANKKAKEDAKQAAASIQETLSTAEALSESIPDDATTEIEDDQPGTTPVKGNNETTTPTAPDTTLVSSNGTSSSANTESADPKKDYYDALLKAKAQWGSAGMDEILTADVDGADIDLEPATTETAARVESTAPVLSKKGLFAKLESLYEKILPTGKENSEKMARETATAEIAEVAKLIAALPNALAKIPSGALEPKLVAAEAKRIQALKGAIEGKELSDAIAGWKQSAKAEEKTAANQNPVDTNPTNKDQNLATNTNQNTNQNLAANTNQPNTTNAGDAPAKTHQHVENKTSEEVSFFRIGNRLFKKTVTTATETVRRWVGPADNSQPAQPAASDVQAAQPAASVAQQAQPAADNDTAAKVQEAKEQAANAIKVAREKLSVALPKIKQNWTALSLDLAIERSCGTHKGPETWAALTKDDAALFRKAADCSGFAIITNGIESSHDAVYERMKKANPKADEAALVTAVRKEMHAKVDAIAKEAIEFSKQIGFTSTGDAADEEATLLNAEIARLLSIAKVLSGSEFQSAMKKWKESVQSEVSLKVENAWLSMPVQKTFGEIKVSEWSTDSARGGLHVLSPMGTCKKNGGSCTDVTPVKFELVKPLDGDQTILCIGTVTANKTVKGYAVCALKDVQQLVLEGPDEGTRAEVKSCADVGVNQCLVAQSVKAVSQKAN